MRLNFVSSFAPATAGRLAAAVLASSLALSAQPALATPFTSAFGIAPAARGIASYGVRANGRVVDLGPMRAGATVRVGLLLRNRHEDEIATLARAQGQRGSRYYHAYLTNAQWNAYFAPEETSVARVTQTLQRGGFRIQRIDSNRGLIVATAPVRSAERFFATSIHRMLQRDGAGERYANVTTAVMPAALRGDAVAVVGLHTTDVARYPMQMRRAPAFANRPAAVSPRALAPATYRSTFATTAASPKPVTTTTPSPNPNPDPTIPGGITNIRNLRSGGYGPYAFAKAYDYPSIHGWNGKGQSVGNVISGDFADTDLAAQLSEYGLVHTGTTNRVPVDTNFQPASNGSPDDGESTLDVEAILGLAPGANYYEYLVNTLADVAILDGYNRVVSDNIVGAANSSFGGCEQDDPAFGYAANYVASQGAVKGITFTASTGDTGGESCMGVANGAPGAVIGVSNPATQPYFTAVGGTDLVVNPATAVRVTEIGWTTGGGGVSYFVAEPDWQMKTSGVSASGRNIPDVALDAALETGYSIYQGGDFITGGTSLSSPLMAAMVTEVNEVQGTRNGWINPRLYEIVNAQGYGFAFTDVVGGSNQTAVAVPGYDRVTGIGTPNGFALAGTL